MKKPALSVIILIILAAALAVGLSVSAFADTAPSAVWDATNFGNATWTAVDGASYKITLYYSPAKGSDFSVVSGADGLACASNSYDFIPPEKTGGFITASKTGYYKFKVTISETGKDPVEIMSEEQAFLKLQAPVDVGWYVTSNNIVAQWTPNALNSIEAGYPSPSTVSYQLTLSYAGGDKISTYSIAPGITSYNMNTVLQSLSGNFVFSVYATSEFAFDSDRIDVASKDALTYPIKIDKPGSAFWGSGTNAGIATWTPVNGASKYTVTFYKAEPTTKKVFVSKAGKIVASNFKEEDGSAPTAQNMIVSYKYAQVGQPQTVNASSNTVENPQCDIENVSVKDSGIYFFSVFASGQNNATPSAVAGFNKSEAPSDTILYRSSAEEGDTFKSAEEQHNALLGEILDKAYVPNSVLFDFVKTEDIKLDLNNDGTPDEIQSNLSVFLPIGDTVTIGAYRYTAAGGAPTDVPLVWNPTQNASLVSLSRSGDKLTMTGLNAGVVTLKVTAKYSPYAGKEIKVYVSHKPTKLTISGRNSFIVGEGSYQLQLAIEPSTASSDSKYFKWTSNDNTVVSVNEGRITPTATALRSSPSYAEITVESLLSGVSSTYKIAVSNEGIKPARIDVVGNNAVPLKSTLQLTAQVYSDTVASANSIFVTNKEVTWSSSNDKVATVDQNGKVIPKALGKCTITAASKEAGSSHVKGTLEIEVIPEEINITKLTLAGTKTLTVGDTTDIKLTITPTNATDRDVVWSCSGNGTLDYKSELVRTLTATREGTATITVYVKSAPSIKAELIVTIKTASNKPETDVGKTEIITNVKPIAGTGDKKNDYTAEIKETVLNEAIDKLFEEARVLKTTPYLRIKVDTPTTAVSVTTKIPYYSIGRIINYYSYRDMGHLVIETGIGTIDVPPMALRRIYEQTKYGTDVEFRMKRVVTTDLTEAQQKAAGSDKVYEYQIISGGTEITYFSGYPVSISIPFTLTSSQSGKGAQVNYLDSHGYLSAQSTTYNYKTKTVGFDTSHLSMYIPYYYAAEAWNNPYTDVRRYDWYYDSVFYVVDRGLMNGISADHFVPASYTTRAMVVTILHRLAGEPATKAKNTFKDVASDQWYTNAVLWATESGLVSGYGGGRFGPNDPVTREQLGVMLHNYAKFVDITPKYGWDTPMKYPDSYNVSSWARQGAMYCQITGIISGRPGGNFEPKGVATRAELSIMLLRMNDQMEEEIKNRS